ncbi:MAG: ROK family protein [Terrimesophilobacter sp.]
MPKNLALALDLGGTKVEAALIDSSGHLVPGSRRRRPTGAAANSPELTSRVREVVAETLSTLQGGATILGVGAGSAGPIHQENGLISPLNLSAWRDFPLAALLADCVPDTAITLRIDGLCIALAEHWVGAGQGASNFMGMVVSTGIGGGLVLGGRAAPGPTGNAGHIGHLEVGGAEDPCSCGGKGCLEAVASGPRTVAWAQNRGWKGTSGQDLAASYSAGDPIALAAIERCGRAIGRAIGSATALLDLDVVAIGGGFSRASPDLFDFIRRGLDAHTEFDFVRRVQIVPSALGDEAPLVGAGALVHRAELLK